MIERDLNVKYIETNRSPSFQGTTERKAELMHTMLNDVGLKKKCSFTCRFRCCYPYLSIVSSLGAVALRLLKPYSDSWFTCIDGQNQAYNIVEEIQNHGVTAALSAPGPIYKNMRPVLLRTYSYKGRDPTTGNRHFVPRKSHYFGLFSNECSAQMDEAVTRFMSPPLRDSLTSEES